MPIIIPANSAASGGYEVDNSLRFNTASSDYLTKTYSTTATSKKILTVSAWVKRSTLGAVNEVFSASRASDGFQTDMIRFGASDQLEFFSFPSTGGTTSVKTTRVFRDTSSWYNIVVQVNTTDNTAADRVRMYVNGVRETSFATASYPPQNSVLHPIGIASGVVHTVGAVGTSSYFSGYLAEVVYADGQALDATSFGEFDEDSGIWKPIDVSGLTFGNNGFYLEFKQAGTSQNSSGMGADTSGNDNHYAVNNLTAIDQSTDTCTNNFATMNPLDNYWQGSAFSEGSLTVTTTNASQSYNTSSIMVSSGKWYVECKPVSGGSEPEIGIFSKLTGANAGNNSQLSYNANGYAYRASDPGSVWYNGSAVSTSFSQYANGDIVGIALDLDNNKLYFSKNGTFGNSGNPTSGATGTGAISIVAPASTTLGAYGFAANENFNDQNKVFSWNFGSPPYAISSGNTDGNDHGNFEYAVPSGYLALCTKNLSEVDS